MSSLMDSIGNWITPELTSSLASRFGIPADTVHSALQTSCATMLITLASEAHDSTFLSSGYQTVSDYGDAAAAAAASGNVSVGAPTEAGSNLLHVLFGDNLAGVESKIAQTANIPAVASSAVLDTAAPLVIAVLSNKINADGLTMASFGTALEAELPGVKSYLPAGFAIPGLDAIGDFGSTASAAASSAPTSAGRIALRASDEARSSAGWLWPVLLLGALLIAALIWYFNNGKEAVTDTATQAATAVTDSASQAGDAAQNATGAQGAFFKRKLPNGVELNVPQNGVENKLIAFIEDGSKPVGKETWFDFDRLLFASGSATLEPSSNEQLQNVAAIMKAYPNLHVRIGGYTDNIGNAKANVKLSQARASTVMSELVSMGVEPTRLDAKGYGKEHPVADNATEAGRAQNRRIAIRVTKK